MKCRFCNHDIKSSILNLGFAPPSNDYLEFTQLSSPEVNFPLDLLFCESCFLVQTRDFHANHEIFKSDYAYLSSMTESWVQQCKSYCKDISVLLGLDSNSFVIEIASNDGYLLQNFVGEGIPCLGIEPTILAAEIAMQKNVPTVAEFLTQESAQRIVEQYGRADLVIGNNVYAHVPDILDFTFALNTLLNDDGVITLEFPHVIRMIEDGTFDTIYHEHFSYHSLTTVMKIFQTAGLKIWNVEQLQTHGGSLRIYGSKSHSQRKVEDGVLDLLNVENNFGVNEIESYSKLKNHALATKFELNQLLYSLKSKGFSIAAAGAAAKGNTLINFLGVDSDCIDFVCDSAPSKVGKYLPGSHIPIVSYEVLKQVIPDYIIILPWNITSEIMDICRSKLPRETKFIIPQPMVKIIEFNPGK
jgi:hypothetical protein